MDLLKPHSNHSLHFEPRTLMTAKLPHWLACPPLRHALLTASSNKKNMTKLSKQDIRSSGAEKQAKFTV